MVQQYKNNTLKTQAVLPIVAKLCQALEESKISYCHWKSNEAIDRSATGDNDLDLLVARADSQKFIAILSSLGFKEGHETSDKKLPGILNYYGYDSSANRFVHVHVHYQLILGHDGSKNYRLPIEDVFLASATQQGLFKLPSLEFEFIVFVFRMVLKHSTWDTICGGQGTLAKTERRELSYLIQLAQRERISELLQCHIPYVSPTLFDCYVQALQPGCKVWKRVQAGHKLQKSLKAHGRNSHIVDLGLKLGNRIRWGIERRTSKPKKRLSSGGALVALVGGDGSGKTTAVDELYHSFSEQFDTTRVHLGKPRWSLATFILRAFHKTGRLTGLIDNQDFSVQSVVYSRVSGFPGYIWLLREVFIARDRYRTYIKAQRLATNGEIVICDRFPLSQIRLMDSLQANHVISHTTQKPNRLVKFLLRLEAHYYQQITPPDLLIVLQLNPDIAVQRRSTEDPVWIRERSEEIWAIDWAQTSANIVDSSRSKADVLSDIKTFVWSKL